MKSELEKMTSLAGSRSKIILRLLDQLDNQQNIGYLDGFNDALELYKKELYEIGDLINLVFWQSYKITCHLALARWQAGQLYELETD